MELRVHSSATRILFEVSQLKSMLQSELQQINTMDMELKAFEDELPNLFLRKDGVLCHYDSDRNTRIVIPRCLIPRVLHMMHNDMGHFGFKKTFQRIKDKYFWPQSSWMIRSEKDIIKWCYL